MLKTSVIAEDLDDLRLFEKTLHQIKAAGFNAIDPALFTKGILKIIDSPSALSFAAELRKIIEDSGLTVGQCHTALCGGYDQWEQIIGITLKTLPFAAEMGARNPVIHPICPLNTKDPLFSAKPEVIFELNRKMYERLVPVARAHGLTILIENLFADGERKEAVPCWSTYAEELNALMDAFPELSVCLDTGHAVITGQKPADMVRQFGSRIKALHLHGNDRIHDLHLTPFECEDMEWGPFCEALHEIGYQGTINMEVLSFVRRTPFPIRPAMYAYLHECAAYLAHLAEGQASEDPTL